MNPAATAEFRANRRKFTMDELKRHEGKWAAFSADGKRIVDSDEDGAKLYERMRILGETVAYERIEFDDNVLYMGAAEFS